MGFHICEYCQEQGLDRPATSSGDVFLTFTNGRNYVMPDMIVHYVEAHQYEPPGTFMDDVIWGVLNESQSARWQTKSMPERVGYLSGEYPEGVTTEKFQLRLRQCIEKATQAGERRQTRGMHL